MITLLTQAERNLILPRQNQALLDSMILFQRGRDQFQDQLEDNFKILAFKKAFCFNIVNRPTISSTDLFITITLVIQSCIRSEQSLRARAALQLIVGIIARGCSSVLARGVAVSLKLGLLRVSCIIGRTFWQSIGKS